jgi:hypothetical protein
MKTGMSWLFIKPVYFPENNVKILDTRKGNTLEEVPAYLLS